TSRYERSRHRSWVASGEADVSAPQLRVVRGDPSPEELAALTMAVVAAAAGAAGSPAERVRRRGWSDPAGPLRQHLTPGPRGWRGPEGMEGIGPVRRG